MELTSHPVSLPAAPVAWSRDVAAHPTLLGDIAHGVGGPFHVVHPPQFGDNLRTFTDVLDGSGVRGRVYFAKKANKAGCWLSVCAHTGAGVDASSAAELVHALSRGVRGTDIVITGPAKSEQLLWLAARHGCLIAIDALDELERLLAQTPHSEPARILLRVLPEANPDSRFGLGAAELDAALQRCMTQRFQVTMEGFSFHLSGYEVTPRAQLADHLLDRLVAARAQGLAATAISIGGGFAVSYVDADTWARFMRDRHESDFHSGKTFTHFYPYHQTPTGAQMLSAILQTRTGSGHRTLGERFAATDTTLLVEPGRALLDGAGFTVFPVQGFKRRGDYGIITVDGVSMSISEQWKSSEFLPDPVLWPAYADKQVSTSTPVRCCVAGASCLEYDMLTWRKVLMARDPRHGDLLIYPNTAGYQMDKNESEFHQRALPPKIVVACDNLGRLRWQLDDHAARP
ncbi:Y4yA family PLP-dependent enzyme [Mycobacterium sp.]|uniref:Y4yA family PLP-dependent enzyme n=1 Tax=Mycobacterium sp. TaxID=1785 RepID=UPI0025ECF847|nr:Y4yA family PLP-dependent enzyme [Mycobacterium sp.]